MKFLPIGMFALLAAVVTAQVSEDGWSWRASTRLEIGEHPVRFLDVLWAGPTPVVVSQRRWARLPGRGHRTQR